MGAVPPVPPIPGSFFLTSIPVLQKGRRIRLLSSGTVSVPVQPGSEHFIGVLDQIIEACKLTKFLDEKWNPKFLVIIAQKNHHTKFFHPRSPDNVQTV
ncbi:hypothetical protein L2E82_29941 [Cichorium intybus]|uniref:Uncharacterized protein n=1 Tax=Cichorium intybus TaxID=13427 RepID=A0ACB9CZ05_CICIN|nr:hypothetical protein L2E82_29941 [Cichorium intybus]